MGGRRLGAERRMRNPFKSGKWWGRKVYRAARRSPPTPSMTAHPAMGYRMPSHLVTLKYGLLALVGGAIITIAYVIFWFLLANSTREGIAAWAEMRRAEGYTVRYAKLEMSGFPFWLRATLDNPILTTTPNEGPWAWAAGSLVIESRPWSWGRFTARTKGRQSVTAPVAGEPVDLQGTATLIQTDVEMDGGRPRALGVTVAGLALTSSVPGFALALEAGQLDLRALDGATTKKDVPSANFQLNTRGFTLPETGGPLPLGNRVEALELGGDLLGPLPDRIHRDDLIIWRDAGGTLEVKRLALTYGSVDLTTSGTLALNETLQPIGAFTARVEGFFQAVDALKQRGLVRHRDAVTAKLVLSAMSRRPKDGGRPSISLPVSIQNQKLYAGPVPLLKFDSIQWPGTPPEGPEAPQLGGGAS